MKILLVSDTHGDLSLLKKIEQDNKDIDVFIHLGDSCVSSSYLSKYYVVKGNCDDYFCDLPEVIKLNIAGFRFHIEHGNKIRNSLFNYVAQKDCDFFLFGHFHEVINEKFDGKYILNPGSLTRPRDSNLGSYMIVELENKMVKIEVKRVNLY